MSIPVLSCLRIVRWCTGNDILENDLIYKVATYQWPQVGMIQYMSVVIDDKRISINTKLKQNKIKNRFRYLNTLSTLY